ncbi:helix-turn-helix transcriptional regulator [Eggerthella sp. YY7918]|uniref:helix-turn-helix transcriptional regulator n=1 Tax=Eggerthella sp. (strain YY7918) TaxID=502558 RepID=UPI00021717F6|nr:helix-turn-helix transcriptional regulator [Eggerthella sp. YY7918]BAK44004.1 hypothetical protein EGYY_08090 [Eggerthella sp. YY7918]
MVANEVKGDKGKEKLEGRKAIRLGSRKMLLVTVGLGFYLAWLMISITPTIYDGLVGQTLNILNNTEFIGRILSIVPLVFLAAFNFKQTFSVNVFMVVLGVVISVCTLTLYVMGVLAIKQNEPITECIAAMGMGFSICIAVVWGKSFCQLDEVAALRCVAGAHLLAFALTLFGSVLPGVFSALLHIIVILGSAVVYVVQSRIEVEQDSVKPTKTGALPKFYKVKIMFGISAFALIMQYLFSMSEGKSNSPNEVLWIIAGVIVCLIFLLFSCLLGKEIRTMNLSKFVLPLFVLGEFFIFSFDFEQSPIEVFAMGCAWVYFRIFYFMAWRAVAIKGGRSAIRVFALGEALIVIAGMLSTAYAFVAERWLNEFTTMFAICLFAIIASQICFANESGLKGQRLVVLDGTNDALYEACAESVAQEYGLSRQERIIATMLIKGYENEDIQNELVIAYNTLRTHLRNMYRKTGVHSRQELVVLLKSPLMADDNLSNPNILH